MLLDNPKTVVIERDFYGEGQHRFNRELWRLRAVL
jgi:transposase